jgi:2-polyprenyl-6-methoxyphenol hydroxylase-like FAD-dependent oxidoreductase
MRDDRPPPESRRSGSAVRRTCSTLFCKDAESSEVQLLYGNQYLSFEQDDEGVTTRVLDQTSNREFAVRSRYLVGCDGARSAVREQLGIAMHGQGALTHTTNVIFRCANFNELHDKAPGYRYMLVGTEGTWGTIVALNGADQWRMSIIGNALERRRYDSNELKAFAFEALGREFELEILSVLYWTRSELVAERYRNRRVFICGDACHLTSPTGGLGMNTGIGDAIDLSWKLCASLEKWGGENLLQSYEIERQPVAKRVTRFATGNLRIMRNIPSCERFSIQAPKAQKQEQSWVRSLAKV